MKEIPLKGTGGVCFGSFFFFDPCFSSFAARHLLDADAPFY